ncbi:MAG: 50S ribosomal protein L11 methyltransferase [Planctomycetaceae bacterium]
MNSWRPACLLMLLIGATVLFAGCGKQPRESAVSAAPGVVNPGTLRGPQRLTEAGIVRWVSVAELPREIVILDSVFWEPADTDSLRQRIIQSGLLRGARVLEIGTGSGLLSLCCLSAGAEFVVATDLNPAAIDNVRENAGQLGFSERLDARLVPRRDPSAWSVIRDEERFDLVISNPPWEDRRPASVEEFALYDPDFLLLRSLLSGVPQRLRPGGRMWLAYGCRSAIEMVQKSAAELQLGCELLDERRLQDLPELFLPGMLIEIRPEAAR